MVRSITGLAARIGRRLGRRGASAAEFAVLAPILVLLAFGTYDLANLVQLSIRLERAARTGAQVALANPNDAAAIAAAVVGAWPELVASEVAVRCACGGAAMASCDAACAAPATRTVTVSVTRRVQPMLLQGFTEGRGDAVARLR